MKKSKRTSQFANWPPEHLLLPGGDFENKISCDLHGVVLDFNSSIFAFLQELYKGDRELNLDPSRQRFYNIGNDPYLGLGRERWEDAFRTYIKLSDGGFGDLKPYPGVIEALGEIRKRGIAIEIHTYIPGAVELDPDTWNPHGTGTAQRGTLRRLVELGVPIAESELKFTQPDKKVGKMLDLHIPLILEDHPGTAVHATVYSLAAILTPHPYNQGYSAPGMLRLNDWADLAPAVISFFEALSAAKVTPPLAQVA